MHLGNGAHGARIALEYGGWQGRVVWVLVLWKISALRHERGEERPQAAGHTAEADGRSE